MAGPKGFSLTIQQVWVSTQGQTRASDDTSKRTWLYFRPLFALSIDLTRCIHQCRNARVSIEFLSYYDVVFNMTALHLRSVTYARYITFTNCHSGFRNVLFSRKTDTMSLVRATTAVGQCGRKKQMSTSSHKASVISFANYARRCNMHDGNLVLQVQPR